ncbi:MAG: UDP-3-O-[3-hydroxymyristoyl] N-acetylglucosamine deacetylase [Deltaproteobacteria bacterium]|nr:UDP-3-O-[3-hydroxymyristoyl] N-acetylglucosamine deacetylase [Deltaproteobacteria bacterium]
MNTQQKLANDPGAAAMPAATILIVDDEVSIRKTLESVLHDEGFQTITAQDGATAIELVRKSKPSLVLLDIWMSGMDGVETLTKIKEIAPSLPVVMISGHATIATAIAATRLGAADFIEKPLELNALLQAVHRALGCGDSCSDRSEMPSEENSSLALGRNWQASDVDPIVFKSQNWRGRELPQRTLSRSAVLYGQGLHSGKKSGLILEPLPANSGIHFVGVSETTIVPAHVDFVDSTGFATTLKLGQTQAGTIEHLMSALRAYGISNLLVKCNGEVPVLDGSAREFCALFDEVGVEEQGGGWYEIAVEKTLRVGKDREFIQIEPADEFVVDYTLEYPKPVGAQHMTFRLNEVQSYCKEIAPARTFGFVKDIGMLQKQGLALGGRFDNFILFGEGGPINDALRFETEPVRHKILDLIGDLYLLGRPLRGKITARMTGHSDNIALLKLIREEIR